MAEAKGRHDWGMASSVLALLANAHRDPRRKPAPFSPADFNPYLVKRGTGIKLDAGNIGLLKQVFVNGGKP